MHPLHPIGCPDWEYKNHPNYVPGDILSRVIGIVHDLRRGRTDSSHLASDTRPTHTRMFHDLSPQGHEYYVGHYRGENFRCLQYYTVGIMGDPSVGLDPTLVTGRMGQFERLVRGGLAALDQASQLPRVQVSGQQKLLCALAFACRVFELFLRIHPYANGNGHMARFIVWAILGRYGYWPYRWPIEPRPSDPPYTDLIKRYRAGIHAPLEIYILHCIQR